MILYEADDFILHWNNCIALKFAENGTRARVLAVTEDREYVLKDAKTHQRGRLWMSVLGRMILAAAEEGKPVLLTQNDVDRRVAEGKPEDA